MYLKKINNNFYNVKKYLIFDTKFILKIFKQIIIDFQIEFFKQLKENKIIIYSISMQFSNVSLLQKIYQS